VRSVTIPPLNRNETTLPFIIAALNGAVDEDLVDGNKIISCLNTLFNQGKVLDEQAKQFILSFIWVKSGELNRKVPNQEKVIKC
jgi:hypothetical protein